MANLHNLFNGTGKIYQVKPSGAINTYDNVPSSATVLLEACRSRIIYEAQAVDTFAFTDPVYGSHFYFNDSGAAPVGDITGADEVTDYFIVDTRNDAQQGDIVDGNYDVTRRSRITIIPLVPETGTSDELISLGGDLLIGDLVILLPKGGGSEYTITIKDQEAAGVVGGNFKLHNDQDVVLTGTNDVCLFIKNSDAIKEIARPNQQLFSVANKTLTAAGGTYYTLDPSGGAAQIKTERGLVILNGGATLAGNWEVWGENGGDTSISQGTTLEVVLDSPLITDWANGKGLTIFGIQIPDLYCKNYNFIVRAWYNDTDADPLNWAWEARMYVDQLKDTWINLFDTGASGEEFVWGTMPGGYVDTAGSFAVACKTVSHVENTEGLVRFSGSIKVGVAMPYLATGVYLLAGDIEAPWYPNAYTTGNSVTFICPVYATADLGAILKFCNVIITGGALCVSPFNGYDIDVADFIDVSCISYIV